MTETTHNPLPDLLRRLMLSWLAAAALEYLLLPADLRVLGTTDGLAQMSLLRVLLLAFSAFLLLTVAARYLPTEKAERWGLLGIFAALSALSLIANFSVPFLLVCILCAAGLTVYALFGWKTMPASSAEDSAGSTAWTWAAGAAAAAFFLFISIWTIYRIKTFNAPAYDFGIFVQMFHNMKTCGLPLTTVERDGLLSHFRVHMSPIYYLMLPFYCLAPRPETLQVLQAAVMASSVLPLWKLGRHHGLSRAQRCLLCAVLLLVPAFAGGAAYDLHENCFLTPLLLWLLYGIDSRKPWLTAVAALLTLCVKEDAAVYVAVVALYLLLRTSLRYQKEDRRDLLCGGALLAVSLVWFFAVTGYLANVGDGVMTGRYRNFLFNGSDSLVTVIKAVLLNPMKAIFECVDKEKLYFIGMSLWPMLGLPLLTRRYERYVMLIPWLLINLMSDYQYQHDIYYQYAFGSLACLIYLSTVNLAQLNERKGRTAALAAAVAVALLCFSQTIWPKATEYLDWYETYEKTYLTYEETLTHVPEDISVTAGTHFLVHLAQRDTVYSLRHATLENLLSTQCVVLRTTTTNDFRNYHSEGKEDGCDNLIAILEENGYEMIASGNNTLKIYLRP